MKNIGKVRAFLTEFVLVILFFSLSAVIALQLFLKANDKSELSRNMTMAYITAEQTAEKIKIKTEETVEELQNRTVYWYDKDWDECSEEEAEFILLISMSVENTACGELINALVTVCEKDKEEMLCELPVTIYSAFEEGGEA